MLYFALLLVAAALAGVVAALITANSLWAWISIGLSVLAGLVLLVDLVRRRGRGRSADTAAAEPFDAEAIDAEAIEDESVQGEAVSDDADTDSEQTTEQKSVDAADSGDEPAAEPAKAAEEPAAKAGDSVPGEEQTDAADALIVSDLDTEVLVVDEYPRYHLSVCGWHTDRQTIPIGVSEARELGFSPCARCGPDAALAADHRETRESFRTHAEN